MKYFILLSILFLFLFSFGCLNVQRENCDVMLYGEVHDECMTNYAVGEYLKTNDASLSEICKNEMDTYSYLPICYKSLAIAAAYQKNNLHAVSFCDELYYASNENYRYNNIIDCLTEIAIILGEPGICEYAESAYESDKSAWDFIFNTGGVSTNIQKDICEKRATLSMKRQNNPINIFGD